MLHKRRWIAVLCIAAVALAGLAPSASFVFLAALVPLWALFSLVAGVRIPVADDPIPAFVAARPRASRAPPLLSR